MKRSKGNSASNDFGSALRVDWTRRARSDVKKLAGRDADRIRRAIRRFAEDGLGDIERIQGVDPPTTGLGWATSE